VVVVVVVPLVVVVVELYITMHLQLLQVHNIQLQLVLAAQPLLHRQQT
jgi:hypothetical protein